MTDVLAIQNATQQTNFIQTAKIYYPRKPESIWWPLKAICIYLSIFSHIWVPSSIPSLLSCNKNKKERKKSLPSSVFLFFSMGCSSRTILNLSTIDTIARTRIRNPNFCISNRIHNPLSHSFHFGVYVVGIGELSRTTKQCRLSPNATSLQLPFLPFNMNEVSFSSSLSFFLFFFFLGFWLMIQS